MKAVQNIYLTLVICWGWGGVGAMSDEAREGGKIKKIKTLPRALPGRIILYWPGTDRSATVDPNQLNVKGQLQ